MRRSSLLRRSIRLAARGAAASAAAGGLATAAYVQGAEEEFLSVAESELPLTYDPDRIASVWQGRSRVCLARLGAIAWSAAPFLGAITGDAIRLRARAAVSRPAETADETVARHAARGSELRELLVSLGPTFIKFGQLLSIRPDVLPPHFVYELQKLCDGCPSYPTADALELIESELGAHPSQIFDGLGQGRTQCTAHTVHPPSVHC